MRRVMLTAGCLVLAGAATVIGLAGSARTAHAEIEGACSATLNGVNVASLQSGNRAQDIRVTQQQSIPVVFQSPAGFASHQIQIEFAGQGVPVSQKADNGAKQFTETVSVAQYARHGVGLYKVVGVATLSDGGTCSGAATVDVAGNPMETTAGQAAAGAAAVGTVMALASTVVTAQKRIIDAPTEFMMGTVEDRQNMKAIGCLSLLPMVVLMSLLMVPLMALPGGGAAAAPAPRIRGGIRITVLGLLSGLLAGFGYVVLLQQYSIAYPTLTVVVGVVGASMLVYGAVLPSIGRTLATNRANRRLGSA